MHTNHRHHILLILAFFAIIGSVCAYVVLHNVIKSQSIRAHDGLHELTVTDEKKKREADTASLYAKTTLEREYLTRVVLPKENIIDFIQLLEQTAIDVGVELELSGVTDESVISPDKIGYFKGHIEINGAWSNVMRALIMIENIPYSVAISDVRLNNGSDQKLPWSLSLDLKVLTTK